MNKILTVVWLACGFAVMPVAFAADAVPADQQKKEQKAAGEDKSKKAGEEGKKKVEKKGESEAEPECN